MPPTLKQEKAILMVSSASSALASEYFYSLVIDNCS